MVVPLCFDIHAQIRRLLQLTDTMRRTAKVGHHNEPVLLVDSLEHTGGKDVTVVKKAIRFLDTDKEMMTEPDKQLHDMIVYFEHSSLKAADFEANLSDVAEHLEYSATRVRNELVAALTVDYSDQYLGLNNKRNKTYLILIIF